MKKNIVFILIFISGMMFSQMHRFVYEMTYRKDSTSNKTGFLKMVLDVGREETKFYDFDFLRVDSLNKITMTEQTNSKSQQLTKRKTGSSVNQNYRDNIFDYFVIESEDEMNWKLLPETKDVADYHLQKAETDFGGRHWIAWFCKDIPINEGPYKFRGLPGLIFEVADSQNNYAYRFVSSKNLEKDYDTTDFLETHYGNNPIKITNEKLNKIKLNYYNDPYLWARTSEGRWSVNIGDGVVYNKKEDLPYLTKREQEQLRRDNNPIEIDKAVKYPLK